MPEKIPRNVIALSLVSFINDMSSKIILPLMPFFITSLGGTGLAIGLVTGIGESVVSFMKIASGHIADRVKNRRGLVAGGYFISALSKLMFAFANSWPELTLFKSGERLGKGIRSAPVDVLLSKSSKEKGKGFGFHRAFDSAGAVIGSLLALAMFFYFRMGFREIFIAAGILGFFSMIPLVFLKEERGEPKKISFMEGISGLSKTIKLLILSSAVFALGNFGYMFFVLRSQSSFPAELAIVIPIILYTIFQVSSTLVSYPAGKHSDTVGRRKMLAFAYLLYILTNIGFIFFQGLPALVLLFIMFGVVYSLSDSMQRAHIAELSNENYRGTSLGVYHAAIGFAALPGGIIAGLLFDVSQELTFAFGAVTTIVALGLLIYAGKNLP